MLRWNEIHGTPWMWWWSEWMAISVLVAVMVAVGGCAAPKAPIDGKIGVINSQRLFNETTAGKRAKDILATFSKNRQTLLELEERELRRMEEDFLKQASVLSAVAKREREEQFRRRMQEYQQKATDLNREIQDKQKEVLEGFRDKVELVVEKVAKRQGLQVVVDKSKGGATVYHEQNLDLSDQVIQEFNRDYP